eukprot:g5313.t1
MLSRFYIADESKNVYGTGYHLKKPETCYKLMTLEEFQNSMNSWTQLCCLMKAEVLISKDFLKDLNAKGLNGEWLAKYMQINDWKELKSIHLYQGSLNGVIPACYYTHDTMLFVSSGKLRVLVMGPEYAFNGLYPYPMHHPYDSYSMVDFDKVELSHWPLFENVRGKCCVLEQGEGLYIPQYSFVHIHILQQGASWLRIGLNSDLKLRSVQCIPLQVSRFIEDYGAMIQDIPHTREWILKIDQGKALKLLDLGTVDGYKKLELIERILTEVKMNIEEAQGNYLSLICEGRLLPTTWLNQNLQDPLLLKDKPILIEDKRTEEQIKYPELFKHVL